MRQKFYHINDELLVKYLLGEATEAEIDAVEEWIATDAANRKHYEDFKRIWDESKSLALKTSVDEDAAWNRFKIKLHQPLPVKPLVKQLHPTYWMRIAALFIVTIGIAYAAYRVLSPVEIETRIVSSKEAPLVDTLTDGSVVTLNKNARLHYPSKFTGKSRPVTLEGEAFFNVTANKEKPFIISVNDISITVVGTSFNVKSKNGVTEVIVETGIVQVRKLNKVVELKPSESIRVSDRDSIMTKDKVADKLYNYYRSKEFVCDDTPLWKLVEVLNAAYDANIIIGNDELRNLKLNTTFNNESLDKILEVISLTFGIKVSKEGDRIILKPNY